MTTNAPAAEDIRSRHRLIANWRQDLLADGLIAIVGDGLVARLVALGAAALGIGTGKGCITLIASPRPPGGIFCEPSPDAEDDDAAAHGIARAVESRYPDCTFFAIPFSPAEPSAELLAPRSPLVINCAGTLDDFLAAAELAQQWRADIVSSFYGDGQIFILAGAEALAAGCVAPGRGQSPMRVSRRVGRSAQWGLSPISECAGSAALAMVTAGLLLGEARRRLMPLPGDAPLEEIRIEAPSLSSPRPCHMVMVGAGASASAAAVGIAPLLAGGCSLAIYDPDVVEASNRSRSWLFERQEHKVEALARWLSRQAPGAQVTPVAAPAGADVLERQPDAEVVLLNTDTWTSRADIDLALARAGRRVALNVGTSPGGVTEFAMGAGAACLRCRRPDLDDLVAEEAERAARPHSCANQPQGSHIITNMIGGGLQARALERYLCAGQVEPAIVTYDPSYPRRLALRSPQSCGCYGQRDGAK